MQLRPDDLALIEANLDVVVAGSERPELLDGTLLLLGREGLSTPALRMVIGEPAFRRRSPSIVAVTDACRDAPLDLAKQWIEAVRELIGAEVGFHSDNAATDVDTDGGGDDRVLCRDDGADGGADAEVGVGHERDVSLDDRQPSRAARLRERLLV